MVSCLDVYAGIGGRTSVERYCSDPNGDAAADTGAICPLLALYSAPPVPRSCPISESRCWTARACHAWMRWIIHIFASCRLHRLTIRLMSLCSCLVLMPRASPSCLTFILLPASCLPRRSLSPSCPLDYVTLLLLSCTYLPLGFFKFVFAIMYCVVEPVL